MDVIFDVDGTLMDNEHRRHFITGGQKDWKSFHASLHLDIPNWPVCQIAHMCHAVHHRIIITTGRFEHDRGITTDQIRDAGVMFDTMLMRPNDDNTPDHDLKHGMLITLRRLGYDPRIAFDDRDRVVAMWREMGLTCFQVAPGDF